jgi:hypothetical protein
MKLEAQKVVRDKYIYFRDTKYNTITYSRNKTKICKIQKLLRNLLSKKKSC